MPQEFHVYRSLLLWIYSWTFHFIFECQFFSDVHFVSSTASVIWQLTACNVCSADQLWLRDYRLLRHGRIQITYPRVDRHTHVRRKHTLAQSQYIDKADRSGSIGRRTDSQSRLSRRISRTQRRRSIAGDICAHGNDMQMNGTRRSRRMRRQRDTEARRRTRSRVMSSYSQSTSTLICRRPQQQQQQRHKFIRFTMTSSTNEAYVIDNVLWKFFKV